MYKKKSKFRKKMNQYKKGMIEVVFYKGSKRWPKFFKTKASASRAKKGLKSVGWRC